MTRISVQEALPFEPMSRLMLCRLFLVLQFIVQPVFAQTSGEPIFSQQTRTQMLGAITTYQAVLDRGGWRAVPVGPLLEPGDRDIRIRAVRARLLAVDELTDKESLASERYDDSLGQDVQRFQRRHGLLPDGRIGPATVRAMSVPAAHRLAQLRLNYERLERLAESVTGSRYVLVNIPALELSAVQDGQVELTSAVVIGKADRQTPELSSRITAVNFHPTWHVPFSISQRDLFPLLKTNPGYLRREGYQFFRGTDNQEIPQEQVLAQKLTPHQVWLQKPPGPTNPLGRIRLSMPNSLAIFLHDSPASWLFSRPARALSSGCVRVARIVELSHWLLADKQDWSLDQIGEVLRASRPLTAVLQTPVPVHLVYVTAWVNQSGAVQFRDDVYARLSGAVRASGNGSN